MRIKWFDARRATEIGEGLADHFALRRTAEGSGRKPQNDPMRQFLIRAEQELQNETLNFYKRAKLANAFKWRLLEMGIESGVAGNATQTLVMHLSMGRLKSQGQTMALPSPHEAVDEDLLAKADRLFGQSSYA